MKFPKQKCIYENPFEVTPKLGIEGLTYFRQVYNQWRHAPAPHGALISDRMGMAFCGVWAGLGGYSHSCGHEAQTASHAALLQSLC